MPAGAKLADVVKALNGAGRHAAGPAGHPAGHEGRRRAAGRAGGDLMSPSSRTAPGADPTWPPQPAALKASAAATPKGAIKEVAKQFEALFMQELMKRMRAATMSSGLLDNEATKLGTEHARHAVRRPDDRAARVGCPTPSRASSSARCSRAVQRAGAADGRRQAVRHRRRCPSLASKNVPQHAARFLLQHDAPPRRCRRRPASRPPSCWRRPRTRPAGAAPP
jgi:hypothetical protein